MNGASGDNRGTGVRRAEVAGFGTRESPRGADLGGAGAAEWPPGMPPDGCGRAGRFVFLEDAQWEALKSAASGLIVLRAACERDDRNFVNAVLSVIIGGCYWTQLPDEVFGNWHKHYHRCKRWLERGLWSRLAGAGAFDAECSRRLLDFVERQRYGKQRRRARRRIRLLSGDGPG